MCIYAILAVDLFGGFGTRDRGPTWTNRHRADHGKWLTCGDEYYGTFFRAFYTLSRSHRRELVRGRGWPLSLVKVTTHTWGAFYISFILLCGVVLINIAVAVLLEKMVDPSGDGPEPHELDQSPAFANLRSGNGEDGLEPGDGTPIGGAPQAS